MTCAYCGGTTFTVSPTALVGVPEAGAAGTLTCTDCRCPVDGWTLNPDGVDATP